MKKINIIFLFLLPFLLTKGWVQAQSIGLRMPDTTCVQGTIVEIPIFIDSSLTGKEVYSYSFQLRFDPYYMQPESIIISGTVCEALGMPVLNTSVSGLVSFANAGTVPLTGNGKFIIIKWLLKKSGWTQLSFTDNKHNYLNEGIPAITLNSGNISILQAPTITIYPDKQVIAKGDQLQMNVYGGSAPYSWSVTDIGLAEIDQNGLLTAKATGMEKVVAIDANGVKDTTQNIEIRSYKLSIPTDLTQWEGATIDIPVLTTDLTGLNVSSGSFQLGFNPDVLSPVSIVHTGTKLASYQVFLQKAERSVSVAFAGSTILSGAGTLVYVRFTVLSHPNGVTNIEIDKALMNENLLAAYSNGYFSVKNFQYRSIYPAQGALVIGESVELNISGQAIPPWKWSVNDSTVASINQTGILTGKKHGQVMVTVIDSAGAPAKTDYFTVFDTRIVIPDTTICQYDRLVEYPIYLETLPRDSIISFEGQLSYDTSKLNFSGIETTGTITQNWISSANETDGKINFACSGSKALLKSGVLLKLKFLPKTVFTSGSWAGMNLNNFALNEGSPFALMRKNAYISGVTSNIASAEITVAPSSTLFAGDTAFLKTIVKYGGIPRFQWLKNGAEIPGEHRATLHLASVVNNDKISCKVISTDPCVTDTIVYSNTIIFSVSPRVGLNSLTSDDIRLYPNPIDDQLHIVLNSSADRNTKVEVFDAIGRMLKIKNVQTQNVMTLDFSNQNSGFYLVKVTLDRGTMLFKIMKR
ncbi:MAG: cohesin domain-containing protein [Paludibacter sp.]|nr:cohesin domain-containing protein [Paludibacter sp.]